jgi:hypothetical protein
MAQDDFPSPNLAKTLLAHLHLALRSCDSLSDSSPSIDSLCHISSSSVCSSDSRSNKFENGAELSIAPEVARAGACNSNVSRVTTPNGRSSDSQPVGIQRTVTSSLIIRSTNTDSVRYSSQPCHRPAAWQQIRW